MSMPGEAVDLLNKLLIRDPIRRLGAGEADAEDIKKHMFFRDVNFDDVYHKRIPPMYFLKLETRPMSPTLMPSLQRKNRRLRRCILNSVKRIKTNSPDSRGLHRGPHRLEQDSNLFSLSNPQCGLGDKDKREKDARKRKGSRNGKKTLC